MKDFTITIKEYLHGGCAYFASLFASLWLGVLVSIFTAGGLSYQKFAAWRYILVISLMTLAVGGGMFLFAWRKGYKRAEFQPQKTGVGFGIACILQLLYAVLFSFSLYTTGPALYAGMCIYSILYGIPSTGFPDVYTFMTMWIFDLIYLGAVMLGEYLGAKARLKDRKALTGQS